MLDAAMTRYNLAMKPEDYIDACNAQLREYLRPPPVVSSSHVDLYGVDGYIRVRVLPEEPESQPSTSAQPDIIQPDRDGHYCIPLGPLLHATSDKRSRCSKDFKPSTRYVRKTTPALSGVDAATSSDAASSTANSTAPSVSVASAPSSTAASSTTSTSGAPTAPPHPPRAATARAAFDDAENPFGYAMMSTDEDGV